MENSGARGDAADDIPLQEISQCRLYEDEYGYVDPVGHSRKISRGLMRQLPSHQIDGLENVPSTSSNTLRQRKSVKRSETLYKTMKLKRVTINTSQINNDVDKLFEILTSDPDLEDDEIKTNLREIHQSLTLKRMVKQKIDREHKNKILAKRIGFMNLLRFKLHKLKLRLGNSLKDFSDSFELWQSPIKRIQGHSGSGVASYFIFLRWLLYLNIFNCVLSFGFIITPQLIYEKLGNFSEPNIQSLMPFSAFDLITGAGWIGESAFYYGHYTNGIVEVFAGLRYNVPLAYLLTIGFLGLINLVLVTYCVAKAYRSYYVYSSGEIKAKLCTKLFSAWDFSIETSNAAVLRHNLIFNDLKVLLSPRLRQGQLTGSCIVTTMKLLICILVNMLIMAITIGVGYLVHYILENKALEVEDKILGQMTLALTVTAISFGFHHLISYLTTLEFFFSKQFRLYLTLARVAVLRLVILGILVYFWIFIYAPGPNDTQCYESSLGEEIYRLIFVNFLMSLVVCTVFGEVIRNLLQKCTKGKKIQISSPEFDIAYNTNDLIYFQTLVWVGILYSPMMPLLSIIILILLFYSKLYSALRNCSPLQKHWRSTQSQTVFLVLTLINFLLTTAAIGYTIINVKPSSICGPFRGEVSMYSTFTDLLDINESRNKSLVLLSNFVKSPAMLVAVVLALCVIVYYSRSYCRSQDKFVNILREQLISESKDKVFLLRLFERAYREEILKRERENNVRGSKRNFAGSREIFNQNFEETEGEVVLGQPLDSPAQKYHSGYLLADVPANQNKLQRNSQFESENDNSMGIDEFIERPMHKQGFQYLIHGEKPRRLSKDILEKL